MNTETRPGRTRRRRQGSADATSAAVGAASIAVLAMMPLIGCASGNAPARLAQGGETAGLNRDDETRKPLDQPGEAARFHMEQRLAAGMTEYPMEHVRATLLDVRARERALERATENGSRAGRQPSWTELGPGNVGGRSRAIVIDPNDPQVMYAAGVAGGVWKSVDGGESWQSLDDFMINLAVSTLAMDPFDSNVLYAGTGEGFAQGTSTYRRGLGIFKSTDAGATWLSLEGTLNGVPTGAFHYVNTIVVSPDDSSRVYAATRFGVWRSLDAGDTWSIVLSNPRYIGTPPTTNGSQIGCTHLAVRDDRDPDVLWAAFGSFEQDGLYRSDDGGDTWLAYTTPSSQGRMMTALAPSDNDVVYILMADNGSGGQTGQLVQVFRSTNGGASFEARVDLSTLMGPWLLTNLALATGCREGGAYSQGWHDNIIAVDPSDPDTVWVGGVDLFRSDDGGRNWGLAGYWEFYIEDPPPPYQIHPDHHMIVFDPEYDGVANQTMFVGNDGGLFRTDNARAATTQDDCPYPPDDPPEIVWHRANRSYGVTQFYHGDSARAVDMFVGGAQDNGTSRVLSRDGLNDWRMIFGGDGGYAAIDPRDHQTLFVTYQFLGNIMKSVNGGETFFDASNGITDTNGIFIVPIAMDESDPDVLWTGGTRPWRTTNGAASWQLAGFDFAGADRISAIGVAPSDGNFVYLGFNNGYVVRTTNGLDASPSWQILTNGLFNGWVSSLAVDHDDPDVAYLTYSTFGIPHVLRTSNGGASWQSIDGIEFEDVPDIPAHWIAVRPCDGQQLYVGTELGVFASDDGGTTWAPVNDGFANVVVESLDFKRHHTLVAFSHGRGAFLVELDACVSCPADVDGTGTVDFGDLLAILAAWGPCGDCREDVDDDGLVAFSDVLAVLAAWGGCP